MKITAIIPTIGERTTELCAELIRKQVSDVVVIEGLKRTEAIHKAWEIGMGADILVLLPSDMLVYPGVVQKLIDKLDGYDRVTGYCESKFRGKGSGGISVYNTKCMPRLLRIAKAMYSNSIRPESEPVVRHFNQGNFPSVMSGLHEYELDYKEIYDRYIYQMIKHCRQVKRLIPDFEKQAEKDKDYEAVLQAVKGVDFNMGKKEPINHSKVIKKHGL